MVLYTQRETGSCNYQTQDYPSADNQTFHLAKTGFSLYNIFFTK
ncbi:hypothetical protein PROVALCAL_01401, partial [Providencia alcalifaciens DSM 30120]